MKFVLKQYDTELISFDLRSERVDGSVSTILEKSEKKLRLRQRGLEDTDRQRKQLRKLIDFRFTRDHNHNLPAKRLKALEAFMPRRIIFLKRVFTG